MNLPVADIAAARDFYTDYLGLSVEELADAVAAAGSFPYSGHFGGDSATRVVGDRDL